VDPWTQFLTWLSTVIVPNWTELVSMLALFALVGIVGPILTIVALMWGYYLVFQRRPGRVRVAEPDAVPAPRGADGAAMFPPNVPFCEAHAVLYPPSRTTCEVDGTNLSVICPVDGSARPAADRTCPACGTKYVLGAGRAPTLVVRRQGPPEGGAAVA
jgi:hypothetical protein